MDKSKFKTKEEKVELENKEVKTVAECVTVDTCYYKGAWYPVSANITVDIDDLVKLVESGKLKEVK